MKKNFLSIFFSSLALVLGFTSCNKDCDDSEACFQFFEDGYVYTYCESYFNSSQEFLYYKNLYSNYPGFEEKQLCDN